MYLIFIYKHFCKLGTSSVHLQARLAICSSVGVQPGPLGRPCFIWPILCDPIYWHCKCLLPYAMSLSVCFSPTPKTSYKTRIIDTMNQVLYNCENTSSTVPDVNRQYNNSQLSHVLLHFVCYVFHIYLYTCSYIQSCTYTHNIALIYIYIYIYKHMRKYMSVYRYTYSAYEYIHSYIHKYTHIPSGL